MVACYMPNTMELQPVAPEALPAGGLVADSSGRSKGSRWTGGAGEQGRAM